ncbi:MAG: hypothetical protein AVDCRST_MAG40-2554, partial [uncultured Gemmatimonadaceae bacterium]
GQPTRRGCANSLPPATGLRHHVSPHRFAPVGPPPVRPAAAAGLHLDARGAERRPHVPGAPVGVALPRGGELGPGARLRRGRRPRRAARRGGGAPHGPAERRRDAARPQAAGPARPRHRGGPVGRARRRAARRGAPPPPRAASEARREPLASRRRVRGL